MNETLQQPSTAPARGLDLRDLFAFVGLACMAIAGSIAGWVALNTAGAAAGGLAVVGAGAFYLGVFHTGRRR